MKGIKKLIISLLALVMVLGASVTAFAAGEGTIKIGNARNGQIYNAYRVFDFTAADEKMENGVYTLSAKFAGLESYTYKYKEGNEDKSVAMSTFFTVGDKGILNTNGLKSEADAILFGKAVLAYAKANDITSDAHKEAKAGEGAANDAEIELTLEGLEYGYYVLDSSLGSAVAVNTTHPVATLNEKNDVPTLDKKITGKANGNKEVIDTTGNNAQIGDTVYFEVVVELKNGGKNYKIVDEMTSGLTFQGIDSVKDANGNVYPYEVVTTYRDEAKTDASGFEMSFAEPTEDVKVTVSYSAVVNANAEISSATNINKAYLVYGNTVTPTVETKTKTYPFVLKKVIIDTDTILAGAKFEVYRAVDGEQLKFTKVSDTEYKVNPDGDVTEIVTVETTPITINGLDAAAYVLVETEAPTGYNRITSTVKIGDKTYEHAQQVVVKEDSTVEAPTTEKVENSTGLLLPSTGGVGVYVFYIFGGILIAAGVAYFILRRMKNAD